MIIISVFQYCHDLNSSVGCDMKMTLHHHPPPTRTQCHRYIHCNWPNFSQTLKIGLYNHNPWGEKKYSIHLLLTILEQNFKARLLDRNNHVHLLDPLSSSLHPPFKTCALIPNLHWYISAVFRFHEGIKISKFNGHSSVFVWNSLYLAPHPCLPCLVFSFDS